MTGRVALGIERLAADPDAVAGLRGRRVGLITNASAIDRRCRSSVDVLLSIQRQASFQLRALYAPEHGLLGVAGATEPVADGVDPISGLPVFSLYQDSVLPTVEMVDQIDTFLFDVQDVGVRFYTFIWTMYYAMRTAALHGKGFVVLDRPNPLGDRLDGPVLDPAVASFVGVRELPLQHGMTIGELAMLFNAEFLDAPVAGLAVVAMTGYRAAEFAAGFGLPWAPPSPNLPHRINAWGHAATGLLDGLDVSVGCGTPMPFLWAGSAAIDVRLAHQMAGALNRRELPGVIFRPAFARPCSGPAAGRICGGVQVHIVDARRFEPLRTGLHLLCLLVRDGGAGWRPEHDLHAPDRFAGGNGVVWFDRLIGDRTTRAAIASGADPDELVQAYRAGHGAFRELRERHRRYPTADA